MKMLLRTLSIYFFDKYACDKHEISTSEYTKF